MVIGRNVQNLQGSIRYAPDTGADGGVSDTGADDVQGGDDDGASGGSEGSSRTIPYERFQQKVKELDAYKALGSPEEIANMAVDAARLQQAIAAGVFDADDGNAPASTQKPESKSLTAKQQAVLEELYALIPGLKSLDQLETKLNEVSTTQSSLTAQQRATIADRANDLVHQLAVRDAYVSEDDSLSEEDAERNTKMGDWIANQVAAAVLADPQKKAKLLDGDLEVVKAAYRGVTSMLEGNTRKVARRNIPSSVMAGGVEHDGSSEYQLKPEDIKGKTPREIKKMRDQLAWKVYQEVRDRNQANQGFNVA